MSTGTRWSVFKTAFVCVLAAMAGCGGTEKDLPTPSPSPVPFTISAVDPPMTTSDVIVVYWSRVDSAEKVFSRLPDFTRGDAVPAEPAPFGGGLSGRALFEFARKAAGPEGFNELLLKQPVAGSDILAPGSAITVGDDANEYFNAYIARTAKNELAAFLVIVRLP